MQRAALTVVLLLIGAASAQAADAALPVPRVLLSRQLMRDARIAVGDTVVLAAEADGGRSMRVQVAGAYEPVPDPSKFNAERYEARLHLPDVIALTADTDDPQAIETVSAINVKLRSGASVDDVI